MAGSWQISVQLDSDSNDVGTISAKWTEVAGTFTYSLRVRKDADGVNTFVAAAIAARNVWQAKNIANVQAATVLLNKFNNIDPQVGG